MIYVGFFWLAVACVGLHVLYHSVHSITSSLEPYIPPHDYFMYAAMVSTVLFVITLLLEV